MEYRNSNLSLANCAEEDHTWESPTPLNDEESAVAKEVQTSNKDANIVDWDGDNDQENPRNWTFAFKCWTTLQLGLLALCASLGSSIISPAETDIAAYTGVSTEGTVLIISLYMYVLPSCHDRWPTLTSNQCRIRLWPIMLGPDK